MPAGDAVVVAAPLGVLKAGSIAFKPPLPARKLGAIQRLGFGVLNKVLQHALVGQHRHVCEDWLSTSPCIVDSLSSRARGHCCPLSAVGHWPTQPRFALTSRLCCLIMICRPAWLTAAVHADCDAVPTCILGCCRHLWTRAGRLRARPILPVLLLCPHLRCGLLQGLGCKVFGM